MQHDLVHGKPPKKTRIGARFGARQTAKKNTNRSTIWCTTNFQKKHSSEHDLVHNKPQKKSTHWSTIWCTTNRKKKTRIGARFGARQRKQFTAHPVSIDFTCFLSSLILKGKYCALNGGIFGASFLKTYIRKSTFFSTIWCTKKSIQNTSGNSQVSAVPLPLPVVNTLMKDWRLQTLQRNYQQQFPKRHARTGTTK